MTETLQPQTPNHDNLPSPYDPEIIKKARALFDDPDNKAWEDIEKLAVELDDQDDQN